MSAELIVKVDAGDLLAAIKDLITVLSNTAPAVPTQIMVDGQEIAKVPLPAPATVPTAGQTPTQQPVQQPPATVLTSAPTYTTEQLAVAATPLIDGGKRQQLVDLLSAFGVQALTQLPKERYGEFATALRQLGAKI